MKLLIQSCSSKKTAIAAQLPAFELYDGVNYRVIKKYFVAGDRIGTIDVFYRRRRDW